MNWLDRIKGPVAVLLGLFFVNVGVQHFTNPVWFEPIVPAQLENARFWVHASGVVEILVGVGLIIPQTRRGAGVATALTLVVLYWANLYMWMENIPLDGRVFETHWHILRGLAQVLMIVTALWVGDWIPLRKTVEEGDSSASATGEASSSSL